MKQASFFPTLVPPISPVIGLTILFFSFLARESLGVDDPQFLACSVPKSCGDGLNIAFPFYIQGKQESYCGLPGFQISCNSNGQPIVNISYTDYTVHEILYQNHTLRVSNADFSNSDPDCIRPTKNINLPNLRFELVPGQTDLSLLYNCSNSSVLQGLPRVDNRCYGGNKTSLVVVPPKEKRNLGVASKECTTVVVAPVEAYEGTSDALQGALKHGFWLKWKARSCSTCEGSGGACVYNKVTYNTQCFCSDGPHGLCCNSELSKKQKIGIGVGCSAGILCLVLIFYLGKRRGVFSKMQAKRTYSGPSSRSDVEAGSVYFGVPVYSYSELEEATNNFDVERELGEGGFGTVYYGKLRDGREVAIKRLYEHNYKRVAQFMNEVEILTRLRHRNLVSLYGCTSKRSRELLLVYEYIPNGTVADHIHGDRATPGSPPWPTRMSIAIKTASALAYLHASEIIHRDVKTNNILLDHNFCVKVADFGISRLFPIDVTHVSTAPQGTPGYVDPEYHQCYQLSSKSDVYSFGVVLIELISSLPAVDLARHRHDINLASLALKRIESSEYQELIDSNLGFEWDKEVQRMTISVAQLAFRCIQHDKELRPSMDEVLEVLKQIQRRNEAPDDRGKAVDADGIMNIKPPTSQDSDEAGLLKATPLPPSPNSVTDDWTSNSTTPNISC